MKAAPVIHTIPMEMHRSGRIGWLRAAVLGSDDAIVSTASLMIGVAAASASKQAILVAGVAGLVAGAMSMAVGEYVSVSSQRDAEQADIGRERLELTAEPQAELQELAMIYEKRGLEKDLAMKVAVQLSAGDRLGAHLRDELGIDQTSLARPMQAAWISAASFAFFATIPIAALAFDDFSGEQVRDGIIAAWAFAVADPYRAATHNKGIMNGVDAVVIATGNDWRAIEAGAHAYAARDGRYTSLSTWAKNAQGDLIGELEMPMAVGIIGGATQVHPAAKAALKLMGVQTAAELAGIIVSVGLAQNLAALRALATEGIQRGHMSLHARQVAIAAGALGDQVEKVAAQMVANKTVRIDYAEKILKSLEGHS